MLQDYCHQRGIRHLKMDALKQMLAKKGRDVFVNTINALHTQEKPNAAF